MSLRAIRIGILVLVGGAVTAAGCANTKRGQRGESCRSKDDCAGGLTCVAGICGIEDFGLKPTGMECVEIQCRDASDCCQIPDFCQDFEAECAAGDMFACEQFNDFCMCEGFACEADECVETCMDEFDCSSGAACVAGKCVECAADDDCLSIDGICVDNECEPRCDEDLDCPFFHACQNEVCVEVGCTADRECIAARRNVLAFCEDGECKVPCETDLECGNPQQFNFQACINKLCTDVGCESDTECRIQAGIQPGERRDAECREIQK